MWKRPTLKVFGCTVTLPRGFDTCRGVKPFGGSAIPIYSAFHRFAAHGRCWTDNSTWGGWLGGFTLSNEAAQTFVVPYGTFTLRTVCGTETGPPQMRLIGGFDENDDEILGTTTLDLTGTDDTTQQYVKLPEIQKDVTTGAVHLYAVDVDTSVATLIAVYAPGETIPGYRQYNVGQGLDETLLTTLCKLGFEPAIAADDLIVPGNMGALKLGLQALTFEERVDPANAKIYWADSINLLDSESAELDAAEQPLFNVSPDYGAGSIINVR